MSEERTCRECGDIVENCDGCGKPLSSRGRCVAYVDEDSGGWVNSHYCSGHCYADDTSEQVMFE